MALIARTLEEARSVNEPLIAAQILHVQAGLLAGRGEAAAALNFYQVGDALHPSHQSLCRCQVAYNHLGLNYSKNMPRLSIYNTMMLLSQHYKRNILVTPGYAIRH